MASVCDWRSRDSTPSEYGVDDEGNLMPPGPLSQSLSPPSLMRRMVSTCEAQLAAAYAHNVHSVGATKALLDWLDAVKAACGRPLTQRETSHWRGVFSQFYESMDREDRRVNEGGFCHSIHQLVTAETPAPMVSQSVR